MKKETKDREQVSPNTLVWIIGLIFFGGLGITILILCFGNFPSISLPTGIVAIIVYILIGLTLVITAIVYIVSWYKKRPSTSTSPAPAGRPAAPSTAPAAPARPIVIPLAAREGKSFGRLLITIFIMFVVVLLFCFFTPKILSWCGEGLGWLKKEVNARLTEYPPSPQLHPALRVISIDRYPTLIDDKVYYLKAGDTYKYLVHTPQGNEMDTISFQHPSGNQSTVQLDVTIVGNVAPYNKDYYWNLIVVNKTDSLIMDRKQW